MLAFTSASYTRTIKARSKMRLPWVLHGVGGIKLESILIGGKRFTSAESIQRFCDRRTAAADVDTPPVRTPRRRERAIEKAERELERDGI